MIDTTVSVHPLTDFSSRIDCEVRRFVLLQERLGGVSDGCSFPASILVAGRPRPLIRASGVLAVSLMMIAVWSLAVLRSMFAVDLTICNKQHSQSACLFEFVVRESLSIPKRFNPAYLGWSFHLSSPSRESVRQRPGLSSFSSLVKPISHRLQEMLSRDLPRISATDR